MIKTETVVGVFDTDNGLTSVATPSGVGQTYLISYNPTTQTITDHAQRNAVGEAAGGAVAMIDLSKVAGYIGDGTSSELDALDAALALARSSGRAILLPYGTTNITIPASGTRNIGGVRFVGRGANASTLAITVQGSIQTVFNLDAPGTTWENLGITLAAATAGQYHVFMYAGYGDVLVRNCRIVSHTGSARSHFLKFADEAVTLTGFRFENNDIQNFGYVTLKTNTSASTVKTIRHMNSRYVGNTYSACGVNAPVYGSLQDVVVEGNYIEMNNIGGGQCCGVDFSGGKGIKISNNHFYGSFSDVIHLEEAVELLDVYGNTGEITACKTAIFITDNSVYPSQAVYSVRRGKVHHNTFLYTGTQIAYATILTGQGAFGLYTVYDASTREPAKSFEITDNKFINFDLGLYLLDLAGARNRAWRNVAEGCVIGFRVREQSGNVKSNTSVGCATGIYMESSVVNDHTFEDCTTPIAINGRNVVNDLTYIWNAPGAGVMPMLPAVVSGSNKSVFLFDALQTNTNALHRRYTVTYDGTTMNWTTTSGTASLSGGNDAWFQNVSGVLSAGFASGTGYGTTYLRGSALLTT